MNGPPQGDPYAHLYKKPPTEAEREALAAEQRHMDEPPKSYAMEKPAAPPDALRLKPKPNPAEHHLTGPWRVIADNIINPALENPVSTVLTMNPVGGTVAALGMAKDVAEYGGQKAAEMSLPADVRKMAESDPERMSGERAAVEGAMLALPFVVHGAKVGARKVGPMLRAEIPTDAHAPIRAALKNLTPVEVQNALNDPHLGAMTRRALEGEPSVPKVETTEHAALSEAGERNLGPSVPQKVRESIRTAYRSAMVTPNAEIEGQAPTLADALNKMGASGKRAQHISERRMARVLDGLTDEQRSDFGTKLVHDNLVAEAERKTIAASTIEQEASQLRQRQQQADAMARQARGQQRSSTSQAGQARDAARDAARGAGTKQSMADRIAAARDQFLAQPGSGDADMAAAHSSARKAFREARGNLRASQDAHADATRRADKLYERFTRATDLAGDETATQGARAKASAEADALFSRWDEAHGESADHADAVLKHAEEYRDAAARRAASADLAGRSAREGELRTKADAGKATRDAYRVDEKVARSAARYASREADRMRRATDAIRKQADRKMDAWSEAQRTVQNFEAHVAEMAPRVRRGIEAEPWFQKALGSYKSEIEGPLTADAIASGVDSKSLRQPKSAYVRLASEQRLDDAEMRKALDIAGVKDPSELQRRPALMRKMIGENAALARYFASQSEGPRHGPLAANAGYPGEPRPVRGNQVAVTGSSKMATGSAQSYVTDLRRVVEFDAHDKATKASKNAVFSEVAKVGRELQPDEAPGYGKKVLAFDDKKALVASDAGVHRYEVTPEVHARVTEAMTPQPAQSAGRRGLQKVSDVLTRAQIAGMPVEATSHANTLSSIVGSVPGEKDAVGRILGALPGPGGKLAAIREMIGIDFKKPEIRALENRLADIGALRVETQHGDANVAKQSMLKAAVTGKGRKLGQIVESRGGVVNTSHHWLFGPEGVDTRGRLVLARKYLKANPKATDAELREFVTGKLGNYVSENAGVLPNFMAQGSVLSPFARFQAARIPTSIKTTLGQSGLPTKGVLGKTADVAKTLYRGPVGHVTAVTALNYLLAHHSPLDNEPGHALDVNTGLYAVPGGIKRLSKADADKLGDKASPIYIPAATLNPVVYAGLRATGLRAMIPQLSPEQPASSRAANAVRDVANVGLGTAGPLTRFIQGAVTGTQPYLQADNSFLRTAPRRYGAGAELRDQVKGALESANPALHAFAESGGDAGRTLTSAMEQDGKFMGGPASIASRIAAFTLPRIASPGIGGRTNEQSMEVQLDRRYREATADYIKRIRRAPGPDAVRRIIVEAARDAERNGYDPDAVIVALEKAAANDNEAVAEKQNDQRRKRLTKIRP